MFQVRLNAAEQFISQGLAALDRGDPAAATPHFMDALAFAPQSVNAQYLLGVSYARQNAIGQAEASMRQVLAVEPAHAPALHLLGTLLAQRNAHQEALVCLQSAAASNPNSAVFRRDLAAVELFLGRVSDSRASFHRALALDPESDEAVCTLVQMTDMASAGDEAAALSSAMAGLEARYDRLNPKLRGQLLYALAKTSHDLGEFDRAFDLYLEANTAMRAGITYSADETEATLAATARQFDRRTLEALAGSGVSDRRPVFIVGMPRSGSTLVEQILSAHPEVYGAGEILALPLVIENTRGNDGSRYPAWAARMNAESCVVLGKGYLDAAPRGPEGTTRVADKRLENFAHLGLIHACLPNATIIHCRRHPADLCLSAFTLRFNGGQLFTYDLEELGRYWRAYQSMMAHWEAVLPPGRILHVDYETLVGALEPQARRILDHVGLTWDPACLDFHTVERSVTTASVEQVRRPLYDSAIGRWRPYGHRLGRLFDAMGWRPADAAATSA